MIMNPQLDIVGIRKTLRLKYGCTCGECVNGFLSLRMSLALLCVAEVEYDLLHDSMDATGLEWVSQQSPLNIPAGQRWRTLEDEQVDARVIQQTCFGHFVECLRRGVIPTEQVVLDLLRLHRGEWPPVTRNFLQRGGTVASVSTMIFERAMDGDERAERRDHGNVFGEKVNGLVACRNDHEFGFVSGMCGYKRVGPATSRFVDNYERPRVGSGLMYEYCQSFVRRLCRLVPLMRMTVDFCGHF